MIKRKKRKSKKMIQAVKTQAAMTVVTIRTRLKIKNLLKRRKRRMSQNQMILPPLTQILMIRIVTMIKKLIKRRIKRIVKSLLKKLTRMNYQSIFNF